MANKRTREDYVTFPVSLLALWWNDGHFDFRYVLSGIVKHAKATKQINPNHKKTWDYLSSVAKRYNPNKRNSNPVNQTESNVPLTSIAVETLNCYVSKIECNGADVKDDLGLLAYLSIKSMIGQQSYDHFSWDAIVARMLGYRGGRFSELPKDIQEESVWATYCLGKRGRENLINKLKGWSVAYIPNGKGFRAPAFSYKLSQTELENALKTNGKMPISMKTIKHNGEMPF